MSQPKSLFVKLLEDATAGISQGIKAAAENAQKATFAMVTHPPTFSDPIAPIRALVNAVIPPASVPQFVSPDPAATTFGPTQLIGGPNVPVLAPQAMKRPLPGPTIQAGSYLNSASNGIAPREPRSAEQTVADYEAKFADVKAATATEAAAMQKLIEQGRQERMNINFARPAMVDPVLVQMGQDAINKENAKRQAQLTLDRERVKGGQLSEAIFQSFWHMSSGVSPAR